MVVIRLSQGGGVGPRRAGIGPRMLVRLQTITQNAHGHVFKRVRAARPPSGRMFI